MIFFLTGVPGSGKSYYLVNYSESVKDKIKDGSKLYNQVVHNISGYKNGLYYDFSSPSDLDIEHYKDSPTYYNNIRKLYEYFLTIKKEVNKDELTIQKAEELGLYKILLIVDEAHLYFINDYSEMGKNRYYILLWFISYHRHLFVDIVLATQNLALVDYKFKGFAEYFIKAVPSSLRFNLNPFSSSFTYNYFPDSKMWNDTKYKTEKIKPDKKIFDLYTSGDSVKKQRVYLSTLLIIFGSIIVVTILWQLFQHSLAPDKPPPPSNKNVDNSLHSDIQDNSISSSAPSQKKLLPSRKGLFDVVTCSDLTGDCLSKLTSDSVHIFFFHKMMEFDMVEILATESEHGIDKYYLSLNVTKESYLSNFLIKSSKDKKEESSNFNVDFDQIKNDYSNIGSGGAQ
jgi:zona occludens toxin